MSRYAKNSRFFGILLKKVEDIFKKKDLILPKKFEGNSYHDYGTYQNNDNFEIWAIGKDKVIKAIQDKKFKISGIMWHPERISPNRNFDINFSGIFQMNALILCAGMGSRFNISNDLGPKCLIKFNHRKLIDIQIESLKKVILIILPLYPDINHN